MPPRMSTDQLLGNIEIEPDIEGYRTLTSTDQHPNAVFDGPERKKQVEKKLLRKLDYRVTFLLLVYILNYVSLVVPSQTFRSTYYKT